jgi:hypothetical protein
LDNEKEGRELTDDVNIDPEWKNHPNLRKLARALLNIAREEAARQEAAKTERASEVKPPKEAA